MLVTDYLIDHQEFNWPAILADWAWLLPQDEFTIWLMNGMETSSLSFRDGTVHMLDVGNGSLEKLAVSRDEFSRKIDDGGNANTWLMIPLVDHLVEAGRVLRPGRCYSFIVPPVLGGEYTFENVIDLAAVKSICFGDEAVFAQRFARSAIV